MRGIKTGLLRSAALAALMAASTHLALSHMAVSSARAEAALDTSKLSRIVGAQETFASPATTIFTTSDTVEQAAAATLKLLATDGWQVYEDPFSARAVIPNQTIVTLKKGGQSLNVFVALAPAQGNRTSVSYTAAVIADDLPFPKDAVEIKYAPDKPHLELVTGASMDVALAFFRAELEARGWEGWSRADNRKVTRGENVSEPNESGRFAFFVREGRGQLTGPLMLMLRQGDDGRLSAKIERVPQKILTLLVAKDEPAEEKQPAAAPPAPNTAFDDLAGDIMNQVRKATEDALADIGKPASRAKTPAAAAATPLAPKTPSPAPIPVPETAEEVQVDGGMGTATFMVASDVQSVAAFYRDTMVRDGWQRERSVIDQPRMVVLNFKKDGKDLSLTVMTFGDKTRVNASGAGLKVAAETAEPATGIAPAAVEAVEFKAEELAGLPIPAPHSSSGTEKSLFRLTVHTTVTASAEQVQAFYDTALAARGWKQAGERQATAEGVQQTYTSPEGPAILALVRRGSSTTASLTLRKTEEARKSGLMPAAGKTRLLFGNVLDEDVVLTIGKGKTKIAAGAGAEGPNGPTMEIAPGKYAYTVLVQGRPAHKGEIDVAADDIWGLMVGPGGVLTLPVY